MTVVGVTFRAPKSRDNKGWQRVEKLIARGIRFNADEQQSEVQTEKRGHPNPKPKGVVSLFQMKKRKRRRAIKINGTKGKRRGPGRS